MSPATFGRFRHLDEVKAAVAKNPAPEMAETLTYREAAARYQEEFARIGLARELPKLINVIKNLAAKGVLRRWEVAGHVRIAPADIEAYLRIAGQMRPIE